MKTKKTTKFLNKKNIAIISFLSLFLLTLIVSGLTLIGLGYASFNQFLKFKNFYSTLSPSLQGFNQAWSTFNENANMNGWTNANIDMFLIGIIFSILFLLISVSIFAWYKIRKNNKKINNNVLKEDIEKKELIENNINLDQENINDK